MLNQMQITPWMLETLDQFITHLTTNKEELTIKAYTYDVSKFLEYLHDNKIRRIGSIVPLNILNYLGYCKKQGKSDASIHRYYMSIRAYFNFLRQYKYLEKDLTIDIAPPKNKQKLPKIPTVEEINAILNQPNINTESGMRDRAMLELLYSSGLRASELFALNLDDIYGHQVLIRRGKGDKARRLPINDSAYYWTALYLTKFRGNKPGILFQTLRGRPIRYQVLCTIVSHYARKAGVQNVTTHILRHACATHMIENGADISMIKELLGHSSLLSTQRYVHLSSHKIQNMFQQFHPRKAPDEHSMVN
jgi:integrase/recombinase XerD